MAGAGEVVIEEKSREMASSSGGFCYSEISTGQPAIQIPAGFVSDPDMFNLTTSMDMIGFSKNLQPQTDTIMWKTFLPKTPHHAPAGASSSKTIADSASNNFYPNDHHYNKAVPDFTSGISETTSDNLIHHHHDSSAATWQDNNRLLVDDSSLRCVFPCEGNERPSQGLSLSLSSSNPLSIGLQSFELRHTNHHLHPHPDFVSSTSRDKLLGKSVNPPDANNILYQPHYVLKNSKYLAAAQELLNEFCSLGTKQSDHVGKHRLSSQKNKQWEDDDDHNGSGSCSKKHPVGSLEFVELQKRKTKLLAMLEEVERRYRHYCSQMKGVVSSFEAVAGNGAARVYSALALKAMSRHFRCLKDGILGEIETTRRSMGEKDPVAPGTTKGETPRLRIIDQALRQQRAFQQMNMMESHPWRPQRGLPERSVSLLRAWLFEHFLHPYPSDMDKHILARQTGLSRSQVSNWFINARVRLWKPMVEEMYIEEVKEHEEQLQENNMNMGSSDHGVADAVDDNTRNMVNADQKPIQDQRLLRIDSDCVSSIINNNNMNHPTDQKKDSNSKNQQQQQHHSMNNGEQSQDDQQCAFGCVELDFSSYSQHHSGGGGMVSYSSRNHENFRNGSTGVSLTLGLQQQGESGSGVSLAFPPPTHQASLFYARDQMEECQAGVQYSLLDAEPQNLPYRNLMGAQLLHDLAG